MQRSRTARSAQKATPRTQQRRNIRTRATKRTPQRPTRSIVSVTNAEAPTQVMTALPKRAMSTGAVPNNGWVEGPNGVKRPISPSIQIWKFGPDQYIHVGVRITGCILTGALTIAGLTAAFGTCDIPAVLDQIKINAPVLVPLLKASIVAPLAYHGLGGARQLFQDFTAKGYDHEFQEKTSYAIAGAAAIAGIYAAAI